MCKQNIVKGRLSIIIPTANEWPVIAFTARAVLEELRGRVDFELIIVDNWCPELAAQGAERDRTFEYFESMARGWPELKILNYNGKLSHWNAKKLGVAESTGEFIQFLDAHVIPSRDAIFNQYQYYKANHVELNGVLHMPVTYHVMEYHKLMYKLVTDIPKGHVHYSFTGYREADLPYTVPCMTTDGIMMTRELYDSIGGFPEMLGIWGGGENFVNFTLAIMGKNVWMCASEFMNGTLNHHGDKRGYSYNYDDLCRNRCVAAFMYGGKDFARTMMDNYKGSPSQILRLYNQVVNDPANIAQRTLIESQQVMSIQEWCAKWIEKAAE